MVSSKYGCKEQARILVVDDDPSTTRLLAAILEKYGYEVATAFSGEEAIVRAAFFAPNLLLSDICMGAMSGIEAATQITSMLPDCKVLFLSGHSSMSEATSAAPEGLVYAFASKPLHPIDLLNAVAYMLPSASADSNPVLMAPEHDANQRHVGMWN